jgi:hypothetical protein
MQRSLLRACAGMAASGPAAQRVARSGLGFLQPALGLAALSVALTGAAPTRALAGSELLVAAPIAWPLVLRAERGVPLFFSEVGADVAPAAAGRPGERADTKPLGARPRARAHEEGARERPGSRDDRGLRRAQAGGPRRRARAADMAGAAAAPPGGGVTLKSVRPQPGQALHALQHDSSGRLPELVVDASRLDVWVVE